MRIQSALFVLSFVFATAAQVGSSAAPTLVDGGFPSRPNALPELSDGGFPSRPNALPTLADGGFPSRPNAIPVMTSLV
jgi:hypothetical protein